MNSIIIVKTSEIEVQPFVFDDFTQDKETNGTIKKVTKKELKILANDLGLMYEDSDIIFVKKMLTAYLKKMK